MAITTSNNNNVEFLGLTSTVRENILRALVGNLATVQWAYKLGANTDGDPWLTALNKLSQSATRPTLDESYTVFKDSDDLAMLATDNGIWVKVYPGRGLYSSDGETGAINYDFCVYLALSSTRPDKSGSNVTEPWDDEPNYARFPLAYNGISQYLTICNDDTNPADNDGRSVACVAAVNAKMQQEIKFNRSTKAWDNTYEYFALYTHPERNKGEIIAWGKLTNPIEVTQADVVPLFEEGKFRLFFPAPEELETYVDADFDSTEH